MTPGAEELPHGIMAIDTMTAGMTSVTAGYLVRAPRPALVECGPALSIDHVVESLRGLGMDPADLAYLVLSHIHLDHAGGAGDVAAAFPSATVVVSEVGARHLVDPERLNASSRRVYGELMDTVYGPCTPVAGERVRGVADGDVLDLGGGRSLTMLYTPGHARHHIAALDPDSGVLFVGDSVGVKLPGMHTIRPAMPPPDFDLALTRRTLSRYRSIAPHTMYLSHYGAVEPPLEALQEASEQVEAWARAAESAYERARAGGHDEVDHVAETLARRFADQVTPPVDDPQAAERLELLNGFRANAMGLVRWLRTRDPQAPPA